MDEIEKELKDMPLWQNHEQRITALEVTTANIKSEFKEVKDDIGNVKELINKGNTDQANKLEIIDKRLMDEFFNKKNRNHENIWKLILKVAGALIGAGSFIYLAFEKLVGG